MKNKKTIIGIIVLVVILALALTAYFIWRPKSTAGAKTITAKIFVSGEMKSEYTIQTDAEYLREALESKDLIQGQESQYGLFIEQVDGVKADSNKQEWWCITKSGEQLNTGVSDTPIQDGDTYELTLKVGY